MKRHRTIAATLILLVSALLAAPGTADAGGPLLSGYGPPGAGAQTILGAALVNGPGGGSTGGGSAGGDSTGTAAVPRTGSSATGAESLSASSQPSATRNPEHASHGRARAGSTAAAAAAPGTHMRAAGATPNSSHLGVASAVVDESESTSWFSGADLLALVLASAVLAIVAVATVRLTRTEHD
jgi:hypothetical protein